MVLSSVRPLSVWVYEEFYLRFAGSDYSTADTRNLFVHLTNNSITKYSDDSQNSVFEGLMWTHHQFIDFLEKKKYEDQFIKIKDQIRNIVKCTILSAKDNLGRRGNSFAMLGFDLMVDEQFGVWLLEVNAAPSMEHSTVL